MEEEVILALKLPRKEQEIAFSSRKKQGIFKLNMDSRAKDTNSVLIRERSLYFFICVL